MTSLILGSLRRERSSTLRALRPCCINDLWLRLDCRICWPRKRSETTTATLLASDARSARLMDDMTILALAPRTGIRNQLLDDLPQHLTRYGWNFSVVFCGIIPSNRLASGREGLKNAGHFREQ